LLDKYKVEYIYVGGCEREKFNGEDSDMINIPALLSYGSICYPEDLTEIEFDPYADTYIIKVENDE
jgi:hypothetical protein